MPYWASQTPFISKNTRCFLVKADNSLWHLELINLMHHSRKIVPLAILSMSCMLKHKENTGNFKTGKLARKSMKLFKNRMHLMPTTRKQSRIPRPTANMAGYTLWNVEVAQQIQTLSHDWSEKCHGQHSSTSHGHGTRTSRVRLHDLNRTCSSQTIYHLHSQAWSQPVWAKNKGIWDTTFSMKASQVVIFQKEQQNRTSMIEWMEPWGSKLMQIHKQGMQKNKPNCQIQSNWCRHTQNTMSSLHPTNRHQ